MPSTIELREENKPLVLRRPEAWPLALMLDRLEMDVPGRRLHPDLQESQVSFAGLSSDFIDPHQHLVKKFHEFLEKCGILAVIARGAFLVVFSLCSCASPQSNPAPSPAPARRNHTAMIEIASYPPGCIVEWNGEYLGLTPFLLTIDSTPDGKWLHNNWRDHILQCTAPNGQTDSRSWKSGSNIPDRILFRPLGGRYAPVVTQPKTIPHIWKAKGLPRFES